MSGARNASSDPYTSPIAARTRIGVRKSCTPTGKSEKQMRRNPNAAAFETRPERTAETSAGDSRYASGSQPWNGKSGALTMNAAAKPRKIQSLAFVPPETIEKVPAWSP